jgi:hypothetical protein
MLSLVFVPGVPFQHQVSYFKIIAFGSFVKDLLYVFMDDLCFVEYFLSGLLQVNHLIYPSLRIIWFGLHLLQ